QYDELRAGGYVILQAPVASANGRFDPEVRTIKDALTLSRMAYGTSFKTTRLTVDSPWWNPARDPARDTTFDDFSVIRGTTVFCQSEPLALALEPIEEKLCGKEIELDDLFDGLESGRWVIVSGDRADLPAMKGESSGTVPGLQSAELAMLGGVRHGFRASDGSIQEI